MNISPCGINCDACPLKAQCGNACQVSGGKPFFIKDFGVERCPIYDCAVNKKGYKTCGECADVPCRLFYDWKDPSMSDEEHRQSVDVNVAFLKELKSQGCAADE
jgi:hypothetical protein